MNNIVIDVFLHKDQLDEGDEARVLINECEFSGMPAKGQILMVDDFFPDSEKPLKMKLTEVGWNIESAIAEPYAVAKITAPRNWRKLLPDEDYAPGDEEEEDEEEDDYDDD